MAIKVKGEEVSAEKLAKRKKGMQEFVDTPESPAETAAISAMAEATSTASNPNITDEQIMESLKKTTDALEATILNTGGEMVDPLEARTIEVKYNPSVARVVRSNGNLTRVHPFKLIINNKEVEVNEKIVHLINKILIDL